MGGVVVDVKTNKTKQQVTLRCFYYGGETWDETEVGGGQIHAPNYFYLYFIFQMEKIEDF